MDASRATELAVETVAFIEAQRADDVWRVESKPEARVDHSLYHGTAGVILTLLELHDLTGDTVYERRAIEAGRTLAEWTVARERSSVAFATGWEGFGWTLRELHRRTGDAVFADAARHARTRLIAQATSLGGGIGWIETAPFGDITGFRGEREIYDVSVGAAGVGLAMVDNDVETAVRIGDRLLEVGEARPDGLRWALMSDMPFAFTAPNYAHGGAGVGFFFARLSEVTGSPTYRDAAFRAGEAFVAALQPVGHGQLVCHTEEQQPSEFYLGMCHGPAGSGRLLATLGRLSGDPKWTMHLDSMLDAVDALGAPEQRSWGWWNNHSRCCGDSGLGDAALLFADAVPAVQGRSLTLARRCADVIESRSTLDAGMRSWLQAEHRARPNFVQHQTGYMQGAAGIASFLIHLASHGSSKPVRIALPDDKL